MQAQIWVAKGPQKRQPDDQFDHFWSHYLKFQCIFPLRIAWAILGSGTRRLNTPENRRLLNLHTQQSPLLDSLREFFLKI